MKYSIIFVLSVILFLTGDVSAQTFAAALDGAQKAAPTNSAAVGVGSVILNGAETNIITVIFLRQFFQTAKFADRLMRRRQ